VLSRYYALRGVAYALFAKQDGRRAGSNTRVKEFLVLFWGGDQLYSKKRKK